MRIRPRAGIEQAEIAVDQIDRNQHADRRHHLGRQHPEQDVLGALGRRERHRPGGRNRDQHGDQRRAAGDDDRIERVMKIVAALLHGRIVLRGPVEEQERRRHREGVELGLEAGQDHPQDREEDQEAEQPGRGRRDHHPSCGYHARHGSGLQIPADDPDQEEGHDVGDHDRDQPAGRRVADVELDQRLRVDQERDVGGLQARDRRRW